MSIRWRLDGRLLCAAMTEPEPGDCYIDDRLHYELSVEARAIIADADHEQNALWHWTHGAFLRAKAEVSAPLDDRTAGYEGEAVVNKTKPTSSMERDG